MPKITLLILLSFLMSKVICQINYKGFIDKYPVELVTNNYSDGYVNAVYNYSNYDEPMIVNGKLHKDSLILFEKNKQGKTTATLVFTNYSSESKKIIGVWKNLETKKELPITLTKEFEIETGDNIEYKDREIIQTKSLKNKYFKLVIDKTKDSYYPRVTGVKVLQMKTDSLLQYIKTDCELRGINNIEIGDFNFDSIQDFSVFESHYAGANTSSIYFLFDAKTGKFFNANYQGTSLEFNPKTKLVTENNQCCGGTQRTTATYSIINYKMVLKEQHCFIWNEKKKAMIERKMKDCQ